MLDCLKDQTKSLNQCCKFYLDTKPMHFNANIMESSSGLS